jgi:DNA-binding response OmpR family regulator
VVYGLRPSGQEDIGVLQLLRRAAPDLPLVLVAAEESLVTQKLVQDLRPIYYAVRPLDEAELIEAVRAALARRHRAGV